jgi:hypothetical protein
MLSLHTKKSRIMHDSICENKFNSTHEGPKSIALQLMVAGMAHAGKTITYEHAF